MSLTFFIGSSSFTQITVRYANVCLPGEVSIPGQVFYMHKEVEAKPVDETLQTEAIFLTVEVRHIREYERHTDFNSFPNLVTMTWFKLIQRDFLYLLALNF